MKVLIVESTHITLSRNGASMYHHNLAKLMQSWGWQVVNCGHQTKVAFDYDGIQAMPYSNIEHLYKWADIIITTPGKFRHNPDSKPIVLVQHNTNREPFVKADNHVLYCGYNVKRVCNYGCKSDHVFWPINRYEGAEPLPPNPSGKITLVNCNANKGGRHLIKFAEDNPDLQFLGITEGYGHQITKKLPNLEYRAGNIDLREVLKDTSILIMPSEKEGLPTLALEAMSLGIPVFGSDIPAFDEIGATSAPIKRMIAYVRAMLPAYNYFRVASLHNASINAQKNDKEALKNWFSTLCS